MSLCDLGMHPPFEVLAVEIAERLLGRPPRQVAAVQGHRGRRGQENGKDDRGNGDDQTARGTGDASWSAARVTLLQQDGKRDE
jgi:hypothetical protein